MESDEWKHILNIQNNIKSANIIVCTCCTKIAVAHASQSSTNFAQKMYAKGWIAHKRHEDNFALTCEVCSKDESLISFSESNETPKEEIESA